MRSQSKRYAPEFQLIASVGYRVNGTDVEVKVNKEKVLKTWFTAAFQRRRGAQFVISQRNLVSLQDP